MFKKIQKLLFPTIIDLSALAVSASAAFYSVSGLSKLFAGAAFAVIIMAASLEVAKLVIASLLWFFKCGISRNSNKINNSRFKNIISRSKTR